MSIDWKTLHETLFFYFFSRLGIQGEIQEDFRFVAEGKSVISVPESYSKSWFYYLKP